MNLTISPMSWFSSPPHSSGGDIGDLNSERGGRLSAAGRWRATAALLGAGWVLLASPGWTAPTRPDPYAQQRREMVEQQIRKRGIKDPRLLAAMEVVPRHLFVPEVLRDQAHADRALPIGHGQNIYQPWLVALMSSFLDLDPNDRVLEIGTGSGYHTAVLSRMAGKVYTIEIIEDLGRRAGRLLEDLGYNNIELRIGDGYQGWAEAAPFDAIVLTAAPPEIPQLLLDQLAVGGIMVAPVGAGPVQELQVITKTEQGFERQFKGPYVVPPMRRDERR